MSRKVNLADWANIFYLAFVLLLVLVWGRGLPDFWTIVAVHVVLLVSLLVLINFVHSESRPFFQFCRFFYPIAFFTYLYPESGLLSSMFHEGYYDSVVQSVEQYLFACQPAIELSTRCAENPVLTETVHLGYFSYYFYFPIIAFLYWFWKRSEIRRVMFNVSVLFYLCYSTFFFFPVIGPISERPGTFSGVMPSLVDNVYMLDTVGGAFPSSHVAVAVLLLIEAFRLSRKAGFIMLPFVVALTIGTVACRIHYMTDVIGGLLTLVLVMPITDKIWRKFEAGKPLLV
ncbi:MAG: phosphatase PAP2 family protein [Planctomycetota bacterium]